MSIYISVWPIKFQMISTTHADIASSTVACSLDLEVDHCFELIPVWPRILHNVHGNIETNFHHSLEKVGVYFCTALTGLLNVLKSF